MLFSQLIYLALAFKCCTRVVWYVMCIVQYLISIRLKKIKRVLHPYGLKYIILILESISEMRDGTLIYVQILGIYWRLSLGYVGTYNDDKIRTIKVLKIGKSRMGSIVAVAWRLPSPTSEIALQTRMYIMDHYLDTGRLLR